MEAPVLMAGVTGSTITLNWASEPPGRGGWYELECLELGEKVRTVTNSYSRVSADGERTFRVTVYTSDGRSASSTDVTVVVDTQHPDIPVVKLSNEGIIVKMAWNTVPNAVSYEIVCNGGWVGDVAGPPDALAGVHFVHHAWHDGVYNYQVRAMDPLGRWSAFSSPVTHIVDTAPPKPPSPVVVAQGLHVQVDWKKPEGKPVRYSVRMNGEDVGQTEDRRFVLNVHEPGPYSFRVRSVDSEGRESEWSEVTDLSSVYIGGS